MPVFRNRNVLNISQNLRAFLNVEAGVVRGEVPGEAPEAALPEAALEESPARPSPANAELAREVESLRRRLEAREAEVARLKGRESDDGASGVRAERVIWSFGMARTGSTWLSRMMGDLSGFSFWNEPLVGSLFGRQYYQNVWDKQREGRSFIMADRYRESWLNSIRAFFLAEANAHYPDFGADDYLFVKEPNGSVGAPLLAQATPESRMIFLIRDPRDVVASSIDGHKDGAWSSKRRREAGMKARPSDIQAQKSAEKYLEFIGKTKEAYEIHAGPKAFVRYEELRAEPLPTMTRILSTLDLPVDEKELASVVEKHSWENIPEEQKGEGKFHRKASPGGWREDLTRNQVRIVETTTAPLLKEFYAG